MEERRLCIVCKEFLPLDKFKQDVVRSVCRFHYNEHTREMRHRMSKENPRRLQSTTIWQMAFIDAQKVFGTPLEMSPAEVRALLENNSIAVDCNARLVPVDPCKPISMENYCLTTSDTRREMCKAWKNLRLKPIYLQFFTIGRLVYVSSHAPSEEKHVIK